MLRIDPLRLYNAMGVDFVMRLLPLGLYLAALLALEGIATASAESVPKAPPTRVHIELDHANIAVTDLPASGAAYQRLGFTLKTGRPHLNSIANLHAKFLDGTEVELITASEPRDDLALEFLQLMRRGDGGAFVALRSFPIDSIAARLQRAGHAAPISRADGPRSIMFSRDNGLRAVWFLEVLRPWIDRPEYTTHANGGLGLRAVWLSSNIATELEWLLDAFGYVARPSDWPLPGGRVVSLDAGEIYLVPLEPNPNGRPLVGVTIAVQSLHVVETVLQDSDVEATRHTDPRGSSLLIRPIAARGAWLEFLETPWADRDNRDR